MKYLLDQGLPRSTVEYLRELGIASEHVGNLGMAQASDSKILEAGRDNGWVVVTLDADFHALLAHSHATTPSVVRIRVEGMKGDRVAKFIQQIDQTIHGELSAGVAVTMTERRLALRRLPLLASVSTNDPNEIGMTEPR